MDALFEVRYLDLTWYDENTVISVTPALIPLDLEFDSSLDQFVCTTVVYPKAPGVHHGQLGFRFLGSANEEPYLQNAELKEIPLKRVVDSRSETVWWIEGQVWTHVHKRWLGRAHRTAGHLLVLLDTQVCRVNIGVSESSSDDLDNYLSDFKADLWELILDPGSYVTAKVKTTVIGGVSEETIHLVAKIISSATKVLEAPKSELRETQSTRRRQQVKPVTRTFMELSTKPQARLLTSRATIASHNVAENRYVLFALERTLKMVGQMVRVAEAKATQQGAKLSVLRERLAGFRTDIRIDEALVRRDLLSLESAGDLASVNQSLAASAGGILITERTDEVWRKLFFRIRGQSKNGGYFGSVKSSVDEQWFESEPGVCSVFLSFSDKSLERLIEMDLEYAAVAVFSDREGGQPGKKWYAYTISKFRRLEVVGGEKIQRSLLALKAYSIKMGALQAAGWIRKLNPNELAEQTREKQSVLAQLSEFEKSLAKTALARSQLSPKYSLLKKLVVQLRALNVKPLAVFPNSMTFVQNPDYQGVHTGYKSLLGLIGMADDDLLLTMEQVDEMGLVNMPMLYERWCLVQIVKVFIQVFQFTPSPGYKSVLLELVLNRGGNDSLLLSHPELGRTVRLMYEPILDNGKTPDFVLDVAAATESGIVNRRFVLDAKYYTRDVILAQGGISSVIENLFTGKDYSEGANNCVFVIHPAENALPERVSPQAWGRSSYLGEVQMFGWDAPFRRSNYHQYGAICASPTRGGRYLDEFQRLIGMFLQYGMETNRLNSYDSDNCLANNLCIACGSHDVGVVKKNNGNSRSAWYECRHCHHFTVYNHCSSCNTRLIKNGAYWTYHSQMPIEPLNIKCPSCESLL